LRDSALALRSTQNDRLTTFEFLDCHGGRSPHKRFTGIKKPPSWDLLSFKRLWIGLVGNEKS
jgi:hypothetical protein